METGLNHNTTLEGLPGLRDSNLCNPVIERLGWVCGVAFTTFGLTLGIRTNHFDVLNLIKKYLPPGLLPSPTLEVDRLYSVLVDDANAPTSITIEVFGKLEELVHTSILEVDVTRRTARELLNQLTLQNPELESLILTSPGNPNSPTFLLIDGCPVEDLDAEISEWKFNHQLYVNTKKIGKSKDLKTIIDLLESDLLMYIANWAKDFLFIHAGAVSWNNRGIIIPGASFSGKTSLVAAFLRAGAKYYSDEYAVLDMHGNLHPYAKLLSIRTDGEMCPIRCSADALNGMAGETPVPVSHIIVTKYEPDVSSNLCECSKGQAALSLLKNSVSVRRQPEFTMKIISKVAMNAQALKGSRGEADEIVSTLLNTLFTAQTFQHK